MEHLPQEERRKRLELSFGERKAEGGLTEVYKVVQVVDKLKESTPLHWDGEPVEPADREGSGSKECQQDQRGIRHIPQQQVHEQILKANR